MNKYDIKQYDKEKIGERIKTQRNLHNLTQQSLSEKIGIGRTKLVQYEKGKDLPPFDAMLEMCNMFNCELGYLLCEHEEKTRTATDIHDVTGLSEDAINKLIENERKADERAKAIQRDFMKDENYTFIPTISESNEIINHIIENADNLIYKIKRLRDLQQRKQITETDPNYKDFEKAYNAVYESCEIFGGAMPPYNTLCEMFEEEIERTLGNSIERAGYIFRTFEEVKQAEAIEFSISRDFLSIVNGYFEKLRLREEDNDIMKIFAKEYKQMKKKETK